MKRLTTILLSMATLLLILVPATASAMPGITQVTGVISFNGTHVGKGIKVTVSCNGNVLTDKTDKTGTYIVTFTKQQCPKNSEATVTVTVNGDKGKVKQKVTKVTNKLNLDVINVDVPEFGAIAAISAAILGGGAFMIIRRRQLGAEKI